MTLKTRIGSLSWLLREPARPRAVSSSPLAPWLVVGTVCVGAFMGQLDASIVILALPTLRTQFHASLGQVEWVALAYLLVLVGGVTAVGRLADMAGRKLLYTYGFGVFIVGSALSGLAPGLAFLVAARILQAVGAVMLQADSVALIRHAMPPGKLGRGIGIQGGAQALGLALGPVAGGLLIGLGGWRLIFFINVPTGLVGMLLGWFLLPRTRDLAPRTRFDWLGALIFMPAVGALMAALAFGRERGWASPLIVFLLVSTVLLLVAFLAQESRAKSPMIDLVLFRSISFSAGISSGLLSYLVTFGVLFVVPFFLQDGRHVSPGKAGFELMVLPAALGVMAPFGGRLADRFGARRVTTAGMLVSAGGCALMAFAHDPVLLLLIELGLIGLGLGAFTPANNAAIMTSAPAAQAGLASGILNMSRGLGTSLGVTLTAIVFSFAADPSSGLSAAAFFLTGIALLAALMTSFRGRPALESHAQAG